MIKNLLCVGLGGFLGSIARFSLGNVIATQASLAFPVSTLLVNLLGCVAAGLFVEILKTHQSPQVALFACIGFLGAFTTFSAFSVETVELLKSNSFGLVIFNVSASVSLCLVGTYLGMWVGSHLR